jgi:hypothetical protein
VASAFRDYLGVGYEMQIKAENGFRLANRTTCRFFQLCSFQQPASNCPVIFMNPSVQALIDAE